MIDEQGPRDLRAKLRAQTSQIVAAQAIRKRWMRIGWAATFYAAGALTVFAIGRMPWPTKSSAVPVIAEQQSPSAVPAEAAGGEMPELMRFEPAVRMELLAGMARPAEAAGLYRRAGDLYFQRSDLASAERCYEAYLARLAAVPAADAEDSWLLAAIKWNRAPKPEFLHEG